MPVKIEVTVAQAQALFNLVEKAERWWEGNKKRKDMEQEEVELIEAVEWWTNAEGGKGRKDDTH